MARKAEDLNGYNADTEIKFFLAQCKEAAAYVADNIKLADNNHTWADGAAKMQNPYFAQFSADDMSSYPEIIMWRDYDVNLDIRHSAGQYLRTGRNTGFTRQFVETFLMKNGLPIMLQVAIIKEINPYRKCVKAEMNVCRCL